MIKIERMSTEKVFLAKKDLEVVDMISAKNLRNSMKT